MFKQTKAEKRKMWQNAAAYERITSASMLRTGDEATDIAIRYQWSNKGVRITDPATAFDGLSESEIKSIKNLAATPLSELVG